MDKSVFVRSLIDIDKLLKMKIETKADIAIAEKTVVESFSDFFLLRMIERAKREKNKKLLKLFQEEARNRSLIS